MSAPLDSVSARTARAKHIALASLFVLLITGILIEMSVRLLTYTGDNGMKLIGRFALLPHRPERAIVEAWLTHVRSSTYQIEDPNLGWTVRANGSSELYQSNGQGIRGDPEHVYPLEVPPGKIRILALGDSFTHGDEVTNDEAWPSLLAAFSPKVDVLNMGVPGFGTDQAFLRWRALGSQFRSNIVLMGIWPEDICRNLSLVRYYMQAGGHYLSKPRFVLDNKVLRLMNSPVVRGVSLATMLSEPESAPTLDNDAWYVHDDTVWKPYYYSRTLRLLSTLWHLKLRRDKRQTMYTGQDPSAIEITVAIAQQFRNEVRAKGATPLVLIIPMRELLGMHRSDKGFPLVRALRDSGVDVIDLGPPIARDVESGAKNIYLPSGHFSAAGNRLFARELLIALEPWIGLDRSRH